MSGAGRSLLPFLPAPVAVADPDGRAVYVNPAFAACFEVAEGEARGRPLAEIFAGGAREAVLAATARVCGEGGVARFRLREASGAYAALAAPIDADGGRVGLVFVFFEEPVGEQVKRFHREIQAPLEELFHGLDHLLEQTGGRRAQRFREHVESGLRAAERVRKWSDELAATVDGGRRAAPPPSCDPLAVAREVAEAAARAAAAAGHAFEPRLPASLPAARADGERLAAALRRFVGERLEAAPAGTRFAFSARALDDGVLLAFTETPPAGAASFSLEDDAPPAALAAALEPGGGQAVRVADPVAGVTTSVRLPRAA